MATCLLGFGSNLGDREEVLRAAIAEIDALAGVRVTRESNPYRTRPIGGPANQPEFANAAAVIETEVEPLELHAELRRIETRHGRERIERWAARTLDIDLLLVDDRVIDSAQLTVPHPRMSFRRFVLEPSAEIAGELVHPTIGWTIGRLLSHLNSDNNLAAIVATDAEQRRELESLLTERYSAQQVESPMIDANRMPLWPETMTTWIRVTEDAIGNTSSAVAADYPKLSILIDVDTSAGTSPILSDHDRGPTLRVRSSNLESACADVFAAVEAVWPRLGPQGE